MRKSLGLLAVLAFSLGCGPQHPPTYPVQGRVEFANGNPVKAGSVELLAVDLKVNARGTIDEQGRFTLTTFEDGDGAVAGKHRCVVVQMIIAEKLGQAAGSQYGVVHPRFASYATSGLECEIKPTGENRIVLKVEGVDGLKDGGTEKDHKHEKPPAG